MSVNVGSQVRYFRLDGVVFRVRSDRLDLGAEYLRSGRWVWTPITSGGVIHNPNARELTPEETDRYLQIP